MLQDKPDIQKLEIKKIEIKKDKLYNNIPILTYTIDYPELSSERNKLFINRLNRFFKGKALSFQAYCEDKLYKMAIDQYEFSKENNYPIQKYEAIRNYTVTYNQNCAFSLYFDQYEYTGGAHGTTVRDSGTWNIQRSRQIELADIFPYDKIYKISLLENINNQIALQIKNGTGQYFDDYHKLTADYFNPANFYLTPDGVIIYYQAYDIAPYVSGIPQILIPYSQGNATPPRCW